MRKSRDVSLADLYLYEAVGDSVTPEEFEKLSKDLNKQLEKIEKKKKASFVPFEQFLEENCVIRGQD